MPVSKSSKPSEPGVVESAEAVSPVGLSGPVLSSLTYSLYIAWFWFMATLGGVMMLLSAYVLPGGVRLSFTRAVFGAVSASALAGFPTTPGMNDLLLPGQLTLLGLTGVGVFCSLSLGALALRHLAGIELSNLRIVLWAAGLAGGAALAGLAGGIGGAMGVLGAMGNSALYVGRVPEGATGYMMMVLMPLSLAGGLGVLVLVDVLRRVMGRTSRLAGFSWVTLLGWAVCWLGVVGVFLVLRVTDGGRLESLADAMVLGQSVMGGYGLPVEYASVWSRSLVAWVTLLSGIGLGAGSTSAGVSVTGLGLVGVFAWRVLRGGDFPDKRLMAGVAATVLVGVGLLLVTAGTYSALLATEGQLSSERLLLLAVSCATVSGLTHEPVTVVGPGLLILSLSMLVARVLPVVVIWCVVLRLSGKWKKLENE